MLGALIERATSKPLSKVICRLGTEPVGMRDTSFRPTFAAGQASRILTAAHALRECKHLLLRPSPQARCTSAPLGHGRRGAGASGGAGLFGTQDDYVRFLELVQRAARRCSAMTVCDSSPQTPLAICLSPSSAPLGLRVRGWGTERPHRRRNAAGAWHWSGAYGNHWFVDPANALTVVMLTNTAFAGMAGPVPNRVRDVVYAHL
ncbi:serine hydrolase domain-containing protein [Rhizobium sp. LCM 4573]|uniref:serine hydrolase domain-containing protein n=1 Tax=Rhizobium sp. LCM 4573 TaxID=1848291 RepID=UPI00387E5088